MKDKKAIKSKFHLHVHNFNRNVNAGWNNVIGPYISMAFYITVPEVVIGAILPKALAGSVVVGILAYAALVLLTRRLGAGYNKWETKRTEEEKLAKRKKMKE